MRLMRENCWLHETEKRYLQGSCFYSLPAGISFWIRIICETSALGYIPFRERSLLHLWGYIFFYCTFSFDEFSYYHPKNAPTEDNEKNKYSHGNHGQKISLWDHYFMHKNLLCFIRFYKYPDQMSGNTIIDYLEKDIGFLEFDIEEKNTCTTQT